MSLKDWLMGVRNIAYWGSMALVGGVVPIGVLILVLWALGVGHGQ